MKGTLTALQEEMVVVEVAIPMVLPVIMDTTIIPLAGGQDGHQYAPSVGDDGLLENCYGKVSESSPCLRWIKT